MELQWYVYQNNVAVGFLEITFYSLGKVTSLLCEKSVLSVIASNSLKSSLFDICRPRLELKALHILRMQQLILGGGGAVEFSKNNISALQN